MATTNDALIFTQRPKVWAQALAGMPRLDKAQWDLLDPVSRWLLATRASVLFMTLMSAVFAGLFALRDAQFDWLPWLCCCLGLLFAHATNNLLNDYTDSRRGIDSNNYFRRKYGVHVLEDRFMTMPEFWRCVFITGGIALAFGAYLVWLRSGIVLELLLAGVFFVIFYSWPLKHFGLGEPAVLLVWGPLMIGGSYYVTTGHWSDHVAWLSLLVALGPTTVIFGKHIDKLDADLKIKVRTLPVILGDLRARQCTIAMLLIMYLGTVLFVSLGMLHWAVMLVFANVKSARRMHAALSRPKPTVRPGSYPEKIWPLWFSARAFDHNRRFTALFVLGLCVELVLIRL